VVEIVAVGALTVAIVVVLVVIAVAELEHEAAELAWI